MDIIQSFLNQSGLGIFIIILIGLLFITGCILSNNVGKKYNYLLKCFNDSEEKLTKKNQNDKDEKLGERELKINELKRMEEEFKNSAQLGTTNVNTEVIIQKNTDKKTLTNEAIANILPSFCIALGLIGTFLGLTIAIMNTTGVLAEGTQSMDQFSQAMNGPLVNMSSAFWTSIAGILASMVLNAVNLKMKSSKENFYDCFEDYLDNVIFGIYLKTELKDFNEIVRISMMALAKDMRCLFQDGVKELVNGINKNTIDLTGTVKELTNYTKDLDRLTSSLNQSVENFKDPVDKFKASVYEFTTLSDDLMKATQSSVNKFTDKVDSLNNSLNLLYSGIDVNKQELEKVTNSLKIQEELLQRSYTNFTEIMEVVKVSQDKNSNEFINQIEKLNTGYVTFESGLNQFMDNLKLLQDDISRSISVSLKEEMGSLSNSIVNKLDVSIRELSIAAQEMGNNTSNIGQLIKATNEWIAVTKETL
ncbi:hypothetical protein [Clostridium tarantellae]|uniref:MotA/TolQ/ExbB proton channel domain-containing protein n=1 Tax=Clostridium tarantellae TaxID=39493 RepID=A0A6I1MTW4_9CLOT|nr:hypothetical protein [Clostridium tarantellae]MPQ43669.1 hypothetical protein [Clostridium tarantellae]